MYVHVYAHQFYPCCSPPVHISRMLEELPRHLILLKQEQELKSLLSNVEVLIFMVFRYAGGCVFSRGFVRFCSQ